MKKIFILLLFVSSLGFSQRLVPVVQRVTDYTTAEETTYATTLTGTPFGGAIIYNTTLSKVRNWNGTAFVTVDLDDFLDVLKTVKIGAASQTLTTPIIGAATGASLATTGAITSSGAGIGYVSGAGGTVSQATSRTTTVVLNKLCGTITMFSAAQAAQAIVTFTFTNSFIAATDILIVYHISATNGGAWNFSTVCGAGSATISITNLSSASITSATPLRFILIKGSTN